MVPLLQSGEVLTLADQRKHVLLELPHELYFPMGELLNQLSAAGMTGILSHPERNQGLLKHPEVVEDLVDQGCLMQVTCSSLMGTFGPGPQQMAEQLLRQGLVHFLATDAHSPRSRRPLMQRAFERVVELAGEEAAMDMCCRFPAAVTEGKSVDAERHRVREHRGFWSRVFKRRDAA
jgi:protein-tyrosine phosphatase